jgi:hypothetical protein
MKIKSGANPAGKERDAKIAVKTGVIPSAPKVASEIKVKKGFIEHKTKLGRSNQPNNAQKYRY